MYKLYVTKIPADDIVGLSIGIIGGIPVSESIFLNSGLLLIKKGAKVEITGAEEKIRGRCFEIPVNAAYKYDFGAWKLFVQAGPYAGIGFSARIKQGDDKEKVEFGSEAGQYKRMDYGINIGGGIEIDQVQVGVNYGLGFINLSNVLTEEIRNRVFTVSAVTSFEGIGKMLRDLRDFVF